MLPSAHFSIRELTRSRTANRLLIDNTPGVDEFQALGFVVVRIAEPTRDRWGRLWVSSGYRCVALNRAIGGSKTGQHMKGEALDLIPLDATRDEVFDWIRNESGLDFDQLITYESRPHFHVSYSPDRKNRRQVLRCDKDGEYHAI